MTVNEAITLLNRMVDNAQGEYTLVTNSSPNYYRLLDNFTAILLAETEDSS